MARVRKRREGGRGMPISKSEVRVRHIEAGKVGTVLESVLVYVSVGISASMVITSPKVKPCISLQ